ncbi:MAG: rod shape-determining protein RodA [Deltaproteobacteria bacterium]
MIDRRLLTHFDWVTLTATAGLVITGLFSIYSATHLHMPSIYKKELYWVAIGSVVLVASFVVNYSLFERYAYFAYGASIMLLIAVFIIGTSSGGARRWISLGFLSIQPSEFAKLALIITLARHLSGKVIPKKGHSAKGLLVPGALLILPFLLIAKQPDLGTAIILWMIFWSMMLVVKIRLRTIAAFMLIFGAIAPLGWKMLKGYQKARLTSFIDPGKDPLGSGYHVLQSKIAIGSGGFFGKGFLQGTQGKLQFLPEHHTDFIFATFAEEWGFFGSLIVLGLFLTLVLSGLNTAINAKDRFGFLLALGVTSMFFWHSVINLGMVAGVLPVVGVPLPFISYGGSFLATSMIAAGLLINVRMRGFIF